MIHGISTGRDNGRNYNEAAAELENQNYEKVLEILDEIPDYEDEDNVRKQAKQVILKILL